MKKIILMAAAAIVMAATGVQAQDNKFWVGGSFGFSSAEIAVGNNSYNRVNSFTVLPEFGWNISDRWGLGVQFGTTQTSSDAGRLDGSNNVYTTSVSPFARHTFLTWRALSLFADGGLTWSTAAGEFDGAGKYTDNRVWTAGLFVSPGFAVRLSDRFALTGRTNVFSAGYTNSKSPAWASSESQVWAAELNSPFTPGNFTLGFNVTF